MALVVSTSDLKTLEDCLLNKPNNVALHTRFRALFTLKSLKSEDAVNIISKGLSRVINPLPRTDIETLHPGFSDPSALLKHELAYCLGQMKKPSALPALEAVLRNASEDPMVRHEVIPHFSPPSRLEKLLSQRFICDPGCRSHGGHLRHFLRPNPQRIPYRSREDRPRNLRDRDGQNRVGQYRRREKAPCEPERVNSPVRLFLFLLFLLF